MNKKILLLPLFLAYLHADSIEPKHYCIEPSIPKKFESEEEVKDFEKQGKEYLKCLTTFIEKQNKAIEVHFNAGEKAIETWNSFVQKVNSFEVEE